MKNLLANFVLLIALSIVFSGLTACTKNAGTQRSSVDENTAAPDNSGNSKKVNYPPVPTGIIQAEIKDLEGNTFKIEDKKGKVVLVNLWATWCAPCRAEMPELVEMQEKYQDKDFEVIGLDVDDEETPEQIKVFAEKMKLNYQLGYAHNRLRSEMLKITRMSAIPQTILINREGQLTGVFTGGGAGVINKMKEAVEKTVNE
jgi:thiol-disulfide isomerase/thioredoxin